MPVCDGECGFESELLESIVVHFCLIMILLRMRLVEERGEEFFF